MTNHAVATSGDYLRSFLTGAAVTGISSIRAAGIPVITGFLSVSVIAPHCTIAGILSTQCFVLGPQEGMDLIAFVRARKAASPRKTPDSKPKDSMHTPLS